MAAIDMTPRPISVPAVIQEVRYMQATQTRGAMYSVVLNTPYALVGGMLNGPTAASIYEQARALSEAGHSNCVARLMPTYRGRGNDKGFVNHGHVLEIIEIKPYVEPAREPGKA